MGEELTDPLDHLHISTTTSGMTQHVELPDELWRCIFKHVVSQRDLKNLCLVNKQFYAVAREFLWYEPNLKPYNLEDFLHICKMPIHVLSTYKFSLPRQTYTIGEQGEVCRKLFELICTMDELHSLTVANEDSYILSPDVLMELNRLENLRSLTFGINSCILYIHSYPDFVKWLAELFWCTLNVNELHIMSKAILSLKQIAKLVDPDVHFVKLKVLTLMFRYPIKLLGESYEEVFANLEKLQDLQQLNVKLCSDFYDQMSYNELKTACDKFREHRPTCKVQLDALQKPEYNYYHNYSDDDSDGFKDYTACDKECGYCGHCDY